MAVPSPPPQGHGVVPEEQPPPRSQPPATSSASAPAKWTWGSMFSAQAAKTCPPDAGVPRADAAAPSDVLEETPPKIARGLRKFRPRVFVINPRDAEEVSLRAAPRSDSAEVGCITGVCGFSWCNAA